MKVWVGVAAAMLLTTVAGCGSNEDEPAVGMDSACARISSEIPKPVPEALSGAWPQFAESLERLQVEGDADVKRLVALIRPAAEAMAGPKGEQAQGEDLLRLRRRLRAALSRVDAACP